MSVSTHLLCLAILLRSHLLTCFCVILSVGEQYNERIMLFSYHQWHIQGNNGRIHIMDFADPFLCCGCSHYINGWELYIITMTSRTASKTIAILRPLFKLPLHQIILDNGPQFTSKEYVFTILCCKWYSAYLIISCPLPSKLE